MVEQPSPRLPHIALSQKTYFLVLIYNPGPDLKTSINFPQPSKNYNPNLTSGITQVRKLLRPKKNRFS
jgi:hypothetical protein